MPSALEVVGGHAEPDRGGDVRRARLELPGDVVPVARRRWTSRIISPPARNGGIASSSSRRAQSAPEPIGAEHLVAAERVEVAAQLLDVDRDVRHGLGAIDEDERAGGMGHLDDLAAGVIVPSVLETWVNATSFGFSRSSTSKTSRRRRPSSVIGMNSRSPSFSWTRSCHGTRFAWCSISVRTIASPRPMLRRPHA